MDVYFTCSPANVDTLIQATFGEIEKMKNGITSEDLTKVKNARLKNRKGSLKTNGYWRRGMEDHWTRGEDEKDFEQFESQIKGVSSKQLSKLAKKYLKKEEHLEFILNPQD
jgi:zinc protease